ncbi:MAG: hypothetical protein WA956_02635 [Stenotrophomonas sp.]
MNPVKAWAAPARQALSRHKWRWIAVAASISVLSWLALGAGVVLEVGTGTRIVLAGIAALATEGTVWLSALLRLSVTAAGVGEPAASLSVKA